MPRSPPRVSIMNAPDSVRGMRARTARSCLFCNALAKYVEEDALHSMVSTPWIPVRFPKIDARPANGETPGIQVCDFVLWALQRSWPNGLTPQDKDKTDWVKRLGLTSRVAGGDLQIRGMAGGIQNAADQSLVVALGAGCFRPYHPPDSAPSLRIAPSIGGATGRPDARLSRGWRGRQRAVGHQRRSEAIDGRDEQTWEHRHRRTCRSSSTPGSLSRARDDEGTSWEEVRAEVIEILATGRKSA